jgi:hypothetical protein
MGTASAIGGIAMLVSSDMVAIRPAQGAGPEKQKQEQAKKIKVRPVAGFDSKNGFLGLTGAF